MRVTRRRLRGAPALALGLVLALPASGAFAAGATVTGDDGNPVGLGGAVTIRHMSPEVAFQFAPDEQRYSAEVTGPAGTAASGATCTTTASPSPLRVNYQGNGLYTVVLKVTKNAEDFACAEAVEQQFQFTIAASVTITPLSTPRLFTRRPGELAPVDYGVPVTLNPGADSHEFFFAANATLAPDGGIMGSAQQAFVDTSTGRATVRFDRPGRYTFVARAKVFTSAGDRFSPWSPRVDVTVVAPFDLSTNRFTDSRGPTYRIAGQVRERSVSGRMRVSMARGRRGGKFRRVARPRFRSAGRFAFRFRVRRPGVYRIRYSYGGNATVAAGRVTQVIRITRRFF